MDFGNCVKSVFKKADFDGLVRDIGDVILIVEQPGITNSEKLLAALVKLSPIIQDLGIKNETLIDIINLSVKVLTDTGVLPAHKTQEDCKCQ